MAKRNRPRRRRLKELSRFRLTLPKWYLILASVPRSLGCHNSQRTSLSHVTAASRGCLPVKCGGHRVAQPTLILAWEGGVPRAIRTLRSMGIPVVLVGSEGLRTIGDAYRRLRTVLNKEDVAEVIASRFERRLKELNQQNPSSDQRVLCKYKTYGFLR